MHINGLPCYFYFFELSYSFTFKFFSKHISDFKNSIAKKYSFSLENYYTFVIFVASYV